MLNRLLHSKKILYKILVAFLLVFMIGCSSNSQNQNLDSEHMNVGNQQQENTNQEDEETSAQPTTVEDYLNAMTLEEKIYQLFVVTPEHLAGYGSVKVAGVDVILMPEDLDEAVEGVLQAIEEGRLTEERINESVRRILEAKLKIMSE